MKNKISDLRDHMFAALERLNDETITDDNLKKEIGKAQAIAELGKVIVDSAKTEVMYAKLTQKEEDRPARFLEDDQPKKLIERPASVYTNPPHNS